MEESAIVELLTSQAKGGAKGFEPAQASEPRTTGVGDMAVAEIHMAVASFLSGL
jgi:hypothetical protein